VHGATVKDHKASKLIPNAYAMQVAMTQIQQALVDICIQYKIITY